MLLFMLVLTATVASHQMGINLFHGFQIVLLFCGFICIFIIDCREKNETAIKWATKCLILFFILSLILELFPLGEILARPLVLHPSSENAQAIVVLASGVLPHGAPGFAGYQRFMHGYKLFRDGRAPNLYVSTGAQPRNGHLEQEWVASFARMLEIPGTSFEIITGAMTTRNEAEIASATLIPQGITKILLVTNGPHIFRAVKCFEKVGFQVFPAPVQNSENISDSCESGESLFHSAMHEWLGLASYYLKGHIY